MIQVERKKQENTLSLLKRFSRRVKQSGRLGRFKATQFKKREKSSSRKKQAALKRVKTKEKKIELYKQGKIDHLPQ